MPPPPEARPGRKRFWFISCLLFIVLLIGGSFLVLYITHPADDIPFWFPIAGMILVGIPWLFWIMTCIYRSIAVRSDDVERPPIRAAAVAPAGGGATATNVATNSMFTDASVDSPGGARRVRFGHATVMGSDVAGGMSEKPQENEADGDHTPDGGTGSSISHGDGSSQHSHESEVPLALSMS
ncbi:uncharacterized protein [Elaeis guineensis]|uniref:Uncharacterized protein LOC105051902 n=1 Tax=Elaeis guineensis var. tenera TaxID=51953 RepID=A0A6I9RQQ9_ELAGV|nr:uncharacterized protein LOC105051902 [Elaeis guineensis]